VPVRRLRVKQGRLASRMVGLTKYVQAATPSPPFSQARGSSSRPAQRIRQEGGEKRSRRIRLRRPTAATRRAGGK
jgi:hypothetical protein